MSLEQELNRGRNSRVYRWLQNLRRRMHHHPLLLFLYRLLIIGLGLVFMLMGLIMLVTPGPGLLFIFLGLGLWGTEFHWAHRLNVWAKAKVLGIWYELRARGQKAQRERTRRIWEKRPNRQHYCPDSSHYHS